VFFGVSVGGGFIERGIWYSKRDQTRKHEKERWREEDIYPIILNNITLHYTFSLLFSYISCALVHE
jgi:hypothetical protein